MVQLLWRGGEKLLQRAIRQQKKNARPEQLLLLGTIKSVGDKGRKLFLLFLVKSLEICCLYEQNEIYTYMCIHIERATVEELMTILSVKNIKI